MASYVSPEIRDRFDTLSADLKNLILERNVCLNNMYDLIHVLEDIVCRRGSRITASPLPMPSANLSCRMSLFFPGLPLCLKKTSFIFNCCIIADALLINHIGNSTDHTDHRQSLHEFQIQQFSRQCIRCAPDLLVSGNGKRTLLTHPQIQLHIVLGKLLAVRPMPSRSALI